MVGCGGKTLPLAPVLLARDDEGLRVFEDLFGKLGEILGVYLSRVERVLAPGKRRKRVQRLLTVPPHAVMIRCITLVSGWMCFVT